MKLYELSSLPVTGERMHSPGPRLKVSTSSLRRVSFTEELHRRCPWGHLEQASLLTVFGHLDSRDVAVACCVCSHWQEVGRAQSLWRELLEREFRWAIISLLLRPAGAGFAGLTGQQRGWRVQVCGMWQPSGKTRCLPGSRDQPGFCAGAERVC